jgi:HTH-type transcriptional regulator / antitoxin HipB
MRANTIQALAAVLRGRRVALGWSQADTAAVAGISRKFVSEVEAGKETVELGKVLSLADAMGLDITISFAVGEDGIPADPDVLRLEDLLDDYLRGDDS